MFKRNRASKMSMSIGLKFTAFSAAATCGQTPSLSVLPLRCAARDLPSPHNFEVARCLSNSPSVLHDEYVCKRGEGGGGGGGGLAELGLWRERVEWRES